MSYAIPTDSPGGACSYVEETTPSDVWTPVGSIAPGLTVAIPMRGIGYWKRRLVIRTVGATDFNDLMAGLQGSEDLITYGGKTYSVLSIDVQSVHGTQDTNDLAKQCSVTVELWRP
jgi:hypothetical protein